MRDGRWETDTVDGRSLRNAAMVNDAVGNVGVSGGLNEQGRAEVVTVALRLQLAEGDVDRNVLHRGRQGGSGPFRADDVSVCRK